MPFYKLVGSINPDNIFVGGAVFTASLFLIWILTPKPDLDFDDQAKDDTCSFLFMTKDQFLEDSTEYEREMDIMYEKKKKEKNGVKKA